MEKIKALFLDRDGVININHGYVHEPAKVDFIDGIFDMIARFVAAGFKPIIVTNQSGIARGYYSEQQFFSLMAYFQEQFDRYGLPKMPVFFCPHHPDFVHQDPANDCYCRKPKPGMIIEAATQLNINLDHSVFVGDKLSDMLAAKRAGVGRRLLVDNGQQQKQHLPLSDYNDDLVETDFQVKQNVNAIEV